jgi:hypothetical protein
MKKILIIILLAMSSVFVKGQVGAALKIVGNAVSVASKSAEEAEKWDKLYNLITHAVCMKRNYQLYVKFYANNKDCFLNLDFEKTLNDFDNILKIVETAVTSRITKTTSQVLGSKEDNNSDSGNSVDALLLKTEKAIALMEKLNGNIFTGLQRMLDKQAFSNENSGSGQEISKIMKKIF